MSAENGIGGPPADEKGTLGWGVVSSLFRGQMNIHPKISTDCFDFRPDGQPLSKKALKKMEKEKEKEKKKAEREGKQVFL